MNDAELIARYDGRVPRYTSYPTAPHFSAATDARTYAAWLAALPPGTPLSLYLHVPFCDRLCLYCGCHTTVVRQSAPKRDYAEHLARELCHVAGLIGSRPVVTQVHWGGGTPTCLPNDCLTGIMDLIRTQFDVRPDAEIAIEIDPTALSAPQLDALALMGVTRVSLGVQDFEPAVQQAIGRPQSFAQTRDCADTLRGLGIDSLNLDLIYGLPHQTEESVTRTARQVLELRADRIAVFGYAHVPWMKRHQALIPDEILPDAGARLAQARAMRAVLEGEGGFVPVGLDHFARADDALARAAAERRLHRGFQGYTADAAPALIGIGASAIGCLPQGYVQNAPAIPAYNTAIAGGQLATARGAELSEEDRLRRDVIETIMCDLTIDLRDAAWARNQEAEPLLEDAKNLAPFVADGLVAWDGSRLTVTEAGRPFVRNVAALFDRYLKPAEPTRRHASAV